MLTKDLVQVTTRNGKLFPRLCPPDDPQALSDARDLCDFFSSVPGRTLGDVEEELKGICTTPRRRAFAKLLLDDCKVSDPDPAIMDLRWVVFKNAEDLRQKEITDFKIFTQEIAAKFSLSPTDLGQKIFSDLPAARIIQSFSSTTAANLIEHMNVSQIKTILCLARDVVVTLKNTTTAQNREFLRQVKFHRLIAEVNMDLDTGALTASLSGPLGAGCGGVAYGPRLSNLFSFIAALPQWSIEANVRWKNKDLSMMLDHRSGVKTNHVRSNGGFVPPEFLQLIEAINREQGLTAQVGGEMIDFGEENHCFPDVVVKTENRVFAIELFHGNYKGQIKKRLEAVCRTRATNLLIGIDRQLLKDRQITELVEGSEWFKSYGFEFSQFPTPSAVRKMVMRHV